MLNKSIQWRRAIMCVVSLLVLGGIFAFFFILYPNHLYVREQNMMFLLDNEYIRHYFTKPGWFACLAGDFVTQFLYYVGGGATVITILLALLLLALYGGLKVSLPRWGAFAVALLAVVYEGFRNIDTFYPLASTVSLAGGAAMFQFYVYGSCNRYIHAFIGLLLMVISYWMLGYGFLLLGVLILVHSVRYRLWAQPIAVVLAAGFPWLMAGHYQFDEEKAYTYASGKWFCLPNWYEEDLYSVINSYYFGNYKKSAADALAFQKKYGPDRYFAYYYNLGNAMQNGLPDNLLNSPYCSAKGLAVEMSNNTNYQLMGCGCDLWLAMGHTTVAEHCAMLGLIFSPESRNAKMVRKLAEINRLTGEKEVENKYRRMLDKMICYRWTAHSAAKKTQMILPENDTIVTTNDIRGCFENMAQNRLPNRMAIDYLLCYDLLTGALQPFCSDLQAYGRKVYSGNLPRIYQEALLIVYASAKQHGDEQLASQIQQYPVMQETMREFSDFNKAFAETNGNKQALEPRFGKTYWFYLKFRVRRVGKVQ